MACKTPINIGFAIVIDFFNTLKNDFYHKRASYCHFLSIKLMFNCT
jgi:hypothetical protein